MRQRASRAESTLWIAAAAIGLAAWATVLAWAHYADVDLWARLAVGAKVWHTGTVWKHDVFAFTPVLSEWVDHEWGAGLLFFAALRMLGPFGLMLLKLLLGTLAVVLPLRAARRAGASYPAIFILAAPCAWTVLPGYVPVIRSHAVTYVAFGLVVSLLQGAWTGRTRLLWFVPPIMLLWANIHGGFVTGFGAMACYAGAAIAERPGNAAAPSRARAFGLALGISVLLTLVNPFGLRFWAYLVPALASHRVHVAEWGPMRPWGWDLFTGFRVLFVIALGIVAAGGLRLVNRPRRDFLPGLLLLAATAVFAWLHRRHAPFFGITAAAILPPFLDSLLRRRRAGKVPTGADRSPVRDSRPALACLVSYAALGAVVLVTLLPRASLKVLAPAGQYPVGECDVLAQAAAAGNAVVPFEWGSYVAWRLYPLVKVSMDGRYEETYPESTFELNYRFYAREGGDWAALVRHQRVDFILLDRRRGRGRLGAADVEALGYVPVWTTSLSGLWCRPEYAERLRAAVAALPPTTSDPLDPTIPSHWPW